MHINNLYTEGQFDVVSSLLEEMGYKLDKSIQDYSINGVSYTGNYTFIIEEYNSTFKQVFAKNKWSFKTQQETNSPYSEIQIKFTFSGNMKYLSDQAMDLYEAKIGSKRKSSKYGTDEYILMNDTVMRYGLNELGSVGGSTHCFKAMFSLSPSSMEGNLDYRIMKRPIENVTEYFENAKTGPAEHIIKLKKVNNVFVVTLTIGGKDISYILDSGASEMCINKSMEEYLKSTGSIRSTDYLPSGNYQIADGSVKPYRRVKIAVVKIGELTVEEVSANIVDDEQPLLLGKSFLDRFSSWKVNNAEQVLQIKR